jgi:Ethanolamine utilization protein EutJ (predicted chaperonin)
MADQIKGTDIIEDGHLNDAIQQAEKYLAVLKETDNVVKKLGVDFKKTAQAADGGTAESIDKLNKELIQSNEVKKTIYINRPTNC